MTSGKTLNISVPGLGFCLAAQVKTGPGNYTFILRLLQRLNELIYVKILRMALALGGCPINVSKSEFCNKTQITSFLQSLPLENEDLFPEEVRRHKI